jgi:uncharacterized SAM-dependent methyltransferase
MGRSTDALQLLVQEGLSRATGAKEIPCSLLYDDRGSELYEKITELEEYYPFRAEENLLREHAHDIAKHIPRETVIVELGCGTARKSTILLSAVQAAHGVYVPLTPSMSSYNCTPYLLDHSSAMVLCGYDRCYFLCELGT